MFDRLFKSKFYRKCKAAIKMTTTRIELIRKKRNATQKYMRNDIAELLKNGFDINAYQRAEKLLLEMNISTCFDFMEQFCAHISSHLTVMDKQRECPEECEEAVSSLMFAAARIGELPELRELRTIFSERYGKSLDYYVNKEFVEKLKSGCPSKDVKIQLMQEIASETGLDWNPKALGNELYNATESKRNYAKKSNDNEYNMNNRMDVSFQKKDSSPDDINPVSDVNTGAAGRNWNWNEADTSESDTEEDGSFSVIASGSSEKTHRSDDDDQSDDEERMMNRLLMQTKAPPDTEKPDSVLKTEPQQDDIGTSEAARGRSKCSTSRRTASLPAELTSPLETPKGHARASSFQPEILNSNRHVHPKLPDYDDCIARLEALKGK